MAIRGHVSYAQSHTQVARVRLKVCCISSSEEAALAIAAGADAVGLVGPMPSGPGIIEQTLIRELSLSLPPGISSFLLTSSTDPDTIVRQVLHAGVSTAQLVDAVPLSAYPTLRERLPNVKLVQVLHIVSQGDYDHAMRCSTHVDALLLDSGNPAAGELGGTGRVHNWEVSRQIVADSRLPVFLAGGLHPGNVAQAVETVRPFGIDVCSGVRRNGRLDPELLQQFITALHARQP